MLFRNCTSFVVVPSPRPHHLFQMLCTNQECLCLMMAILDLSQNRTFLIARVEFVGIFKCGANKQI